MTPSKMEHHSQAGLAPQTPSECFTCNAIQMKKCPGNPGDNGPCDECARLRIECLPASGHSGDIVSSFNHENVVRCEGEIKNWISSGEPRVSDGVLRLSDVLGDRPIGMSATSTAQTNSESANQPGSELATRSFLTPHGTYPHTDSVLPTSSDPTSTSHIVAGVSRRALPQGDSIGAYESVSQAPSDIANSEIDQSDPASSEVPSSIQCETYHIDAPVRFILPVVSFLLSSYLPQVREIILVVDDDDDDKAALRDAVAREAANLPGDLGFRVAD